MKLEIHKATAADPEALLATMNEALAFKLAQGDTAWERQPFTSEDIEHAIARGTTYAVSAEGRPAGRVTLTWDCDQIRQTGRPYVRLDCPAANEGLCAYYEHLGFERVGTKDNGGALYQRSVEA